jgi:hypothetical protein
MVAVVEPSQFAGLVAGTSRPQRSPAGFPSALGATVDLPAIMAPAQVEDLAASTASCLSKGVHHARAAANAGR